MKQMTTAEMLALKEKGWRLGSINMNGRKAKVTLIPPSGRPITREVSDG